MRPQDFDINNAGQMVGKKFTRNDTNGENSGNETPGDETLRDLNALPGIAESGWLIGMAIRINNAGQVLSLGLRNNQREHVLLTPVPVPATSAD